MSKVRAYAIVLLVFGAIGLALWQVARISPRGLATPFAEEIMTAEPPSPEIMAYLAKSKSFQYLVSFTDRGFEPSTVAMKEGETVRFINNSAKDLWLSSTGDSGTIYPGTGKECSQSLFDTCKTLRQGEFWEFTFTEQGTWSYHNNFDFERAGVIVVK